MDIADIMVDMDIEVMDLDIVLMDMDIVDTDIGVKPSSHYYQSYLRNTLYVRTKKHDFVFKIMLFCSDK